MSAENDIVMIYFDGQPSLFARIESIEPDIKKDWYHVTLLLLTIPEQIVTWILRDEYIQGTPFTMGGKPVKLENLPKGKGRPKQTTHEPEKHVGKSDAGKIIPFQKPNKAS